MFLLATQRIDTDQSRYFDAWRGGSAIAVLLGHTAPLYFEGERVFAAFAGCAVGAFFGLSGFFIHKSLAKSSSDSFDWRSFGRSRVNRIVPGFLFALAVTVLCWAIAPYVFTSGGREYLNPTVRPAISLEGFWKTAFLLNGFLAPTVSANGPLWSLTYEVWLYIAVAFAAAFVKGRRAAGVGLLIVPILTWLDPMFALWAMVWLAGAGVSVAHANGWLAVFRWPVMRLAAIMPVAGFVLLLLTPARYTYAATLVFQFAFAGWFIVHMGRALTAQRLPRAPFFEHAASYSYTLYVVHFPLLLIAYGIWENPMGAPVAFLIILAAASRFGPKIERLSPLPVARPFANPNPA